MPATPPRTPDSRRAGPCRSDRLSALFRSRTGLPCPVEIVVERLATARYPNPGRANRMLSKLQGVLPATPILASSATVHCRSVQTCTPSAPSNHGFTAAQARRLASRQPKRPIAGSPSAPISMPAVKPTSSSTRSRLSKDAASAPPPSQNTRVSPWRAKLPHHIDRIKLRPVDAETASHQIAPMLAQCAGSARP